MTPLNTIALQRFIQQVKEADLSQQREIKLDLKNAKALAFCISELNARLLMDYDELINNLPKKDDAITVQLDGGGFNNGDGNFK